MSLPHQPYPPVDDHGVYTLTNEGWLPASQPVNVDDVLDNFDFDSFLEPESPAPDSTMCDDDCRSQSSAPPDAVETDVHRVQSLSRPRKRTADQAENETCGPQSFWTPTVSQCPAARYNQSAHTPPVSFSHGCNSHHKRGCSKLSRWREKRSKQNTSGGDEMFVFGTAVEDTENDASMAASMGKRMKLNDAEDTVNADASLANDMEIRLNLDEGSEA